MECSYIRIVKKSGRPKGPERVSLRGKYSKNGCIPCRRQKKKCDEGYPNCKNCTRKLRSCWYSSSSNELSNVNESTSLANSQWIEGACPSPPSQPDLLEESQGPLTPSKFLNTTERMFLDSLVDTPLLTEVFSPSSNPSAPFNSVEYYEEQKMEILASCMLNSVGLPAKERDLLCYFVNDVSMLLFADKTTTRFLGTVIPLSLVDKRVRYPILAIASSHRVNSTTNHDCHVMRDAVQYRAMAQCCLTGQNSDFFDETENVLLGICLVSIQEIFEGNSLYWSSALEKGSEIIKMRGGFRKVSETSPLSIQLFCYLDHVSSLSTCATPYVDRSGDNSAYSNYAGNRVEDILNCKFGFKFGIAGELFKIMGNISTLAGLRSIRYRSPRHEEQFDSLANLIEMKLQNWSPSHIEHINGFVMNEDTILGEKARSSYCLALQWACFLRLHQVREGYNRQDSRVKACLSIILKSIKSIENNSELETGLMFPLIMAGAVCVDNSDREYVLSRIQSIKEKLRFNYIGEFEKLLGFVWDRDEMEGNYVNWAKIRFYQFPGLVIF